LGNVIWTYQYDSANNLENEALSIDGKNFALNYNYNSMGHLNTVTYPSGRIVDSNPNALGQATQANSLVTNVNYYANGQVKKLTYGNSITREVALDSSGRVDTVEDSLVNRNMLSLDPTYDDNDNVAGLHDYVNPEYSLSGFSYDGLNRLSDVSGNWGQAHFDYDLLGNIISKNLGSKNISYHYNATTNRLDSISGTHNYAFAYDSHGNVTNNGRYSLTFNSANQMVDAKGNTYVYDGHNRRVKQTQTGNKVNYSVYTKTGKIIYQEKTNGEKVDHIYLNDKLIARVNNGLAPVASVNVTNEAGNTIINWPVKTSADEYVLDQYINGKWIEVYKDTNTSFQVTGNAGPFRVKACNTKGCSGYKTQAGIAPLLPAHVSVPEMNYTGNYSLTWQENSDLNQTGFIYYVIDVQTNNGVWQPLVRDNKKRATKSYGFSNQPLGDYAYRVKACSAYGCSEFTQSNSVNVTIATVPAITVPTTENNSGSYSISWTPVVRVTRYVLEEKVGTGSWNEIETPVEIGTLLVPIGVADITIFIPVTTAKQLTSKTFSGKTSNRYSYRIKGCYGGVCGSVKTSTPVVVKLAPITSPPISLTMSNKCVISLGWSSVIGLEWFELDHKLNNTNWTSINIGALSGGYSSWYDSGNHAFRLRACNSAGCADYSYANKNRDANRVCR